PRGDVELLLRHVDPDEAPCRRHAPSPWPDLANPGSWPWQLSGLRWSMGAATPAPPRSQDQRRWSVYRVHREFTTERICERYKAGRSTLPSVRRPSEGAVTQAPSEFTSPIAPGSGSRCGSRRRGAATAAPAT